MISPSNTDMFEMYSLNLFDHMESLKLDKKEPRRTPLSPDPQVPTNQMIKMDDDTHGYSAHKMQIDQMPIMMDALPRQPSPVPMKLEHGNILEQEDSQSREDSNQSGAYPPESEASNMAMISNIFVRGGDPPSMGSPPAKQIALIDFSKDVKNDDNVSTDAAAYFPKRPGKTIKLPSIMASVTNDEEKVDDQGGAKTRGRRKRKERTYEETIRCFSHLGSLEWDFSTSSTQIKKFTASCFWFNVCSNYFSRRLLIDKQPEVVVAEKIQSLNAMPINVALRMNNDKPAGFIVMRESNDGKGVSKNLKAVTNQVPGNSQPVEGSSSNELAFQVKTKNREIYTEDDDMFLLQVRREVLNMVQETMPTAVADDVITKEGLKEVSLDQMIEWYQRNLDEHSVVNREGVTQLRDTVNAQWYGEQLFLENKQTSIDDLLIDLCSLTDAESSYMNYLEHGACTSQHRTGRDEQRREGMNSKGLYLNEEGMKVCHHNHGQLFNQPGFMNVGKRLDSYTDRELDDSQMACAICNDGTSCEDNLIVYCSCCNIPVHQSCYGIIIIPKDDWVCNLCKTFGPRGRYLRCALCTKRGGAMKPCEKKSGDDVWLNINPDYYDFSIAGPVTPEYRDPDWKHRRHRSTPEKLYYNYALLGDSDVEEEEAQAEEPRAEHAWVHLACAFWIPELSFGDIDHNSDVKGMHMISTSRIRSTCSLCGVKGKGCCVTCKNKSCQTAFHPECARRAKYFMEYDEEDDKCAYNIYCDKHTPLVLRTQLEGRRQRYRDEIKGFCHFLDKNHDLLERSYAARQHEHFKKHSIWNSAKKKRREMLLKKKLERKLREDPDYHLADELLPKKRKSKLRRDSSDEEYAGGKENGQRDADIEARKRLKGLKARLERKAGPSEVVPQPAPDKKFVLLFKPKKKDDLPLPSLRTEVSTDYRGPAGESTKGRDSEDTDSRFASSNSMAKPLTKSRYAMEDLEETNKKPMKAEKKKSSGFDFFNTPISTLLEIQKPIAASQTPAPFHSQSQSYNSSNFYAPTPAPAPMSQAPVLAQAKPNFVLSMKNTKGVGNIILKKNPSTPAPASQPSLSQPTVRTPSPPRPIAKLTTPSPELTRSSSSYANPPSKTPPPAPPSLSQPSSFAPALASKQCGKCAKLFHKSCAGISSYVTMFTCSDCRAKEEEPTPRKVLRVNQDEAMQHLHVAADCLYVIGILGHVDSGKTSLAKALSRVTSTASLDKNPQSQERGITLDLGFSAFFTKYPIGKYIQYTLVDCPGHASLIKTVIGGASIIDLFFLVIDAVKGIQTQTAECLVIGELLIPKMVVVLNKIDQIPEVERETVIAKKCETLRKLFARTRFGAEVPIIPVSATGGEGGAAINMDKLLEYLLKTVEFPKRNGTGAFCFMIDHCFPIKGQGSVITGTVIEGSAKIGDDVNFPQIQDTKKIKSMQVFHKPVTQIKQGDRAGILFTQLDAKQIERGIACHVGYVRPYNILVMTINKVNYFKFAIGHKTKYHITSGHQTVMGKLRLFSAVAEETKVDDDNPMLTPSVHKGLEDVNGAKVNIQMNYDKEYRFEESIEANEKGDSLMHGAATLSKRYFGVVELESAMLCNLNSFVIGSKLDCDVNANICRIGFYGRVLDAFDEKEAANLNKLRVYRTKQRKGVVDRIVDANTIIIKDLFKKEADVNQFIGRPIRLSTGQTGKLISTFGQGGKLKVALDTPIEIAKGDKEAAEAFAASTLVEMDFKKYYTYKSGK